MCGRISIGFVDATLAGLFDLVHVPPLDGAAEVTPGELAPVVVWSNKRGGRTAEWMRWGLSPQWADPARAARTFNARIETAHERPTFREAWLHRRAIVPASAFWERDRDGQAHRVQAEAQSILPLAGLWERRRDAEGWSHSFTVLTRPADGAVRAIHHRMPVVLRPEEWSAWLDVSLPPPDFSGYCPDLSVSEAPR